MKTLDPLPLQLRPTPIRPAAVIPLHGRSRPARIGDRGSAATARTATVRLLLAQDHALFRSGVHAALESDPAIVVAAETGAAVELVTLARRTHPDVVLLDLEMHGQPTLTYLQRVRAWLPETPVILVADPRRVGDPEELFRHGAAAVILKTVELDELAIAVKAVVGGARREVFGACRPDEAAQRTVLTPREIDTLKAVGSGLTNRAIASELDVTEHTVKFHLTSVYRKLRLRSRAEAAHWAVENGLVSRAFAESERGA